MQREKPLRLEVSNRKDFIKPMVLLGFLAMFAAILSPHPALMTVLILLLVCLWIRRILQLSNLDNSKLISVIFPDGRVRLESKWEESFTGFLDGEQWCSHQLAVLRITNGESSRKLIIRRKQQAPDEFRRLNMWLRQDFCNGTRAGQVLES